MAKTKEERDENSRRNGAKSRGPVTEENKRKVSFNAMRSGYYAEVGPIPNVDPNVYTNLRNDWIDYYKPQSPATFALIDRCVRSTINHDRSQWAHDSIICTQIDTAAAELERRRARRVSGYVQRLALAPAKAAAALRTSGLGCRTLIGKLEAIGNLVDAVGYLDQPELGALLNLVGVSGQPEELRDVPVAFCLMLFNLHAQPSAPRGRSPARLRT